MIVEFLKNSVTSSFINLRTIKITKDLRNIFQLPDFTNEKSEVQRHCGICQSQPSATG